MLPISRCTLLTHLSAHRQGDLTLQSWKRPWPLTTPEESGGSDRLAKTVTCLAPHPQLPHPAPLAGQLIIKGHQLSRPLPGRGWRGLGSLPRWKWPGEHGSRELLSRTWRVPSGPSARSRVTRARGPRWASRPSRCAAFRCANSGSPYPVPKSLTHPGRARGRARRLLVDTHSPRVLLLSPPRSRRLRLRAQDSTLRLGEEQQVSAARRPPPAPQY